MHKKRGSLISLEERIKREVGLELLTKGMGLNKSFSEENMKNSHVCSYLLEIKPLENLDLRAKRIVKIIEKDMDHHKVSSIRDFCCEKNENLENVYKIEYSVFNKN